MAHKKKPEVSVVIVSHNSQVMLPLCLEALRQQVEVSLEQVIVDSGSTDTRYLNRLQKRYPFRLIKIDNIGYARANNMGYKALTSQSEIVIFLNPDVVLPYDYCRKLQKGMAADLSSAVVSGMLVGFDANRRRPSQYIDSTGVFRSWYGRWYDRDQGRRVADVKRSRQYLPAVCGAVFACRRTALEADNGLVFDPDFFLYKEDIELSLRLRERGWSLLFDPHLIAYHARGWQKKRSEVSWLLRKIAAQSEVILYRKHPSPYMVWAMCKYLLVRWAGV
ncbi:glycosyltransferase family 2 protein [Desulfosediminicola sp.]|uniref:glycosyltransferase family 2 protein n=1 Tax=Desulfosediminicola sp. TaxID=2886825 RepID=UPI003AF27D51